MAWSLTLAATLVAGRAVAVAVDVDVATAALLPERVSVGKPEILTAGVVVVVPAEPDEVVELSGLKSTRSMLGATAAPAAEHDCRTTGSGEQKRQSAESQRAVSDVDRGGSKGEVKARTDETADDRVVVVLGQRGRGVLEHAVRAVDWGSAATRDGVSASVLWRAMGQVRLQARLEKTHRRGRDRLPRSTRRRCRSCSCRG